MATQDSSSFPTPWNARVGRFVDELEMTARSIDSILQQTSLDTTQGSPREVQQAMEPLTAALAELEKKVAQRQHLLTAPDAPPKGLGLTEKLRSSGEKTDHDLAARCEQVAGLLGDANHRAVSLFVCQFHLAELTSDIVQLISGGNLKSTYGEGERDTAPARGGLFNESA